jgi:HK97 family phage major capsid protein
MTEAIQSETVPALSAVRAIPAALAPWRYKRLPEWQRDFRSADSDHHIQQYLTAIATGDRERADLLMGAKVAAGGPYTGTVGQLIPLPLSDYINAALYKFSKMHQLARVLTSASGSLRVPNQTGLSVSFWVAEGAALLGTEPEVAQERTLNLQKLTNLATISNEALEDAFGLAEWLTLDVTRQMGQEEDIQFYSFTGSGTAGNRPKGLERASSTIADQPDQYYVPTDPTQTTLPDWTLPTNIDYAHVQKMFFALPEKSRSSAVWTGNDLVEEAIMNLVDGDGISQGRPMFPIENIPINTVSEGVLNQPVPMIFGRPFVNMPGQLDTSGTPGQDDNRLYFINMRKAYVILRKDLRVERSGLSGFANDQTQFRFIHHVDGQPTTASPSFPLLDTGDFSESEYVYTGSIIGAGAIT